MAQTTPRRSSPSIGGIIAALVVVGVFVVLGLMLASNNTTTAQTDTSATAQADTSAVAARDGKYSAVPPMTIDPAKNYTATITTPRGDIEIKLRPDLAPETVNSFVFLANDGFYDGVTWHRVLPNFMAQTGDPTGTGTGGPGYTVKDEFTNTVNFDRPGLVAMANTGAPNSGGSQFFITKAAYPSLDGKYTIFGEVTNGQDIVDAIPERDPDTAPTTPGEEIVKVTVSEE